MRESTVRVDASGRVVIPREMRDALGIPEGGELRLTVQGGELRATTRLSALRRLQAELRGLSPPGELLSEALIADRRTDAARGLDEAQAPAPARPVADPAVLLDASALLAALFDEPGGEAVAAALDRAAIGAVNLAEAMEVAIRRGLPPARAMAWPRELGLPVLPFDAPAAAEAAQLLGAFRRRGLSLGDCACLGTARALGLPVLTADHAWATLGLDVEVRPIR